VSKLKLIFLALLVLLVLCLANSAWSKGKLPEFYPRTFSNEGILQKTEDGGNTLIINATAYKVGHNMKVHTMNNNFASKNSLQKDMEIGFTLHDPTAKRKVITEIWVLPKGTVELD